MSKRVEKNKNEMRHVLENRDLNQNEKDNREWETSFWKNSGTPQFQIPSEREHRQRI